MPMYVAGTERGVRPIGLWSISIARFNDWKPLIFLKSPAGESLTIPTASRVARSNTSRTNELFPEPLTPVTATKRSRGKRTSTFSRLWWLTPVSSNHDPPRVGRRLAGTLGGRPRAAAVTEPFIVRNPPWDITRPPCLPPPGPTSMIWSAARMVSASCSTTNTEFPRLTRPRSAPSRRPVSRG